MRKNQNNPSKKLPSSQQKSKPRPPPPRNNIREPGSFSTVRTFGAPTNIATSRSATARVARVVLSNTERLTPITSSAVAGGGVAYSATINPTTLASQTGSILGPQAQLYEKYRFTKLEFHWKPFVSTSTNGNVIIGADFVSSDLPPSSSYAMTNMSAGYSECNAWAPFCYRFPCSQSYSTGKDKLVRPIGSTIPASSALLYDCGAVYVWIEGASVNTPLGYIDISYDIELIGVQRAVGLPFEPSLALSAVAQYAFQGTSITPTGDYVGSTWPTFTGVTTTATNVAVPLTPYLYASAGTILPNLTIVGNNLTFTSGVYRIKLFGVFLSDTYAQGKLQAFGSVTQSILVTGGVNYATATTPPAISIHNGYTELIVTIPAAGGYYSFSLTGVYNTTYNVNQTLNLVASSFSGFTVEVLTSP